MSYQTLYRKYRPKSFEDVIGQKNIVKILSNAIIHSKIAHAYLFCGPRGTGKTSLAKIFARIVNCSNLNGVTPCGKCDSCKQIENKNFLDIIEIDAASNNGVDEIREIKNKVNLAPNCGRYKVYIIDEVHMLSIGAFNALLKTLEEPPAHIVFILATTEPHKLPVTVISRCQRFDFKKFLNSEIVENLRKICNLENINFRDDILNEIAVMSDGGMRDAIGLLEQLSLYSSDDISIDDLYQLSGTLSFKSELDILKKYFSGDILSCLNSFSCFEKDGKNFIKIAEDMLYLLEQILKYIVIPDYRNEADINLYDSFMSIVSITNKKKVSELILKISDNMKNIKNTYNPRVLFEMIFLLEYENVKSIEKNQMQTNVCEEKIVNNNSVKKIEKVGKIGKKEISKYFNFSLDGSQIESLKKIRINNALAVANKEILMDYKNKFSSIIEYMFDDNYSSLVCNLQDSDLRVAGVCNLIISLQYDSTVEFINERIYLLDELLSMILGNDIKSIVVSNDEWNNIRKEYVNMKNSNYSFELIEEVSYFDNNCNKKSENSDLEGIFGSNINDIIEIR